MATLGSVLLSNVMGHSKAEQAFRPWWDNFEDFLAYGLVMLGKNFDSIEFETLCMHQFSRIDVRFFRQINLIQNQAIQNFFSSN